MELSCMALGLQGCRQGLDLLLLRVQRLGGMATQGREVVFVQCFHEHVDRKLVQALQRADIGEIGCRPTAMKRLPFSLSNSGMTV